MLTVPRSVAERIQSMSNRLARVREDQREQVARVTRTVESGLAGGALGFVRGRYNRTELLGLPLPGAVAATSHILAYAMGGANAEHLHNVGDAATAVYFAQLGEEIGRDRANKTNTGAIY